MAAGVPVADRRQASADDRSTDTVGAVLAAQVVARGAHRFLVTEDDELTYAEADRRSAELAARLVSVGAGKGTRVGLLLPSSPAFVVAWLAAARIGAITIPFSTFSTGPELRTLLRGSDVEVLLAAPSIRGRDVAAVVAELVPSFEAPILHRDLPALRRIRFDLETRGDSPAPWPGDGRQYDLEAAVRASDRMVVVHTSGSTSAPKGVVHQHGPLLDHVRNLNGLRRYGPDEVLFSPSPFFWIGGFAYSLLGTLLAGATLVTSGGADAGVTLDLLERTRPTMVNGFAAAVAHLAAHPSFPGRDLSSIRRGNLWPILPEAIRPADPELRHNLLGMTEAGSVCLASADEGDQPERRRGSFGTPVPGLEASLTASGELRFRGPSLMEGYLGRERHETFSVDGWYATGDLFHVDDEGFFHFHGRAGDMIKTAGANVAPREVEAAILEVTGLVAHVVGITDAERGQLVAAVVRTPTPLDEQELRAALRARLSAYKVPRRFLFVADAEIPVLSSGKVDTTALRHLLGDLTSRRHPQPEVTAGSGTGAALRGARWTVGEVLRRNAAEHGAEAAVVTAVAEITHAELDDRSRAVAADLVAVGAGKGSRVGLLAPNGIDWVVVAMAATRIGATLVPLSTLARPPELAALLRTADVTHLVAAEAFKGRRPLDEATALAPDVPSLRWTVGLEALTHEPAAMPRSGTGPSPRDVVDGLEAAVLASDDLVVLFTSGSTGEPKGAIHTHGGAIAAAAANLEARRLAPGERLYMPMPFFWTGGFATALVSALVAGATLVTEAEPEPGRTLALLESARVTLFRGWPAQAAALAAHPDVATTDLSALGDASLQAVLPEGRRTASPDRRPNIFGMTETFGPWCGARLDLDLPEAERGSCGRPFDGIEVRAVDGELQLRGPNLFRTYAGRRRSDTFTVDGWFPTGDRGRIDDDGVVWFEGRSDDMVKVKGATVYPSEVEVALRAIDGVDGAHVTDVAGEVGAAVVTAVLDEDELRVAARERLSAFKVPTRWLVTSDPSRVPMTATGKVDKRALRALIEEHT